MSTVQKLGVLVLGIAAVTTLILPGRNTGALFTGASKLVTGTISTAQGTSQGAVG